MQIFSQRQTALHNQEFCMLFILFTPDTSRCYRGGLGNRAPQKTLRATDELTTRMADSIDFVLHKGPM
jgi:hypothetical protein